MDTTKKSKLCKVRLRRLRPDMVDKFKVKRGIKTNMQLSSSSSESEYDDINVNKCEKSAPALHSNEDIDTYTLLTEAQAALKLNSESDSNRDTEISIGRNETTVAENNTNNTNINYSRSSRLMSSTERGASDLVYYHSDEEGPCYNCNHSRASLTASVRALAPYDRRSSIDSNSSLSEKGSFKFSKLFENNCISVIDHENPPTALSKILSIKEFDPLAPQQILAIIIKSIVSFAELSQRDGIYVYIDDDRRSILEFSAMNCEEKKVCPLNPCMDVSRIVVTHSDDEFLTFCLCENCEKYREFVIHIMVEKFKATHMVVMLLDVLIQSYGPMLKNITAYNKFKKLLDSNKDIYWITCGVIYHKKAEHLDFIYDEYLSDSMIFVLFSSILMVNNPLLLLQILAFHLECIVKAYAEGFLEIVESDKTKIPADEMINYILNGYDDLMRISEKVSCYLFAFENNFLRKFSLTWKLLSQRLYQQHVHLHLADTMLACIITLKEELTSHHTDLIKRYIQFDDIMNYVEKRWTEVWIELNKFNLSEVERKRRKSLLDVYRIFDTVVEDAIGFSLPDSVDDNDFYDFRFLKNRRLAWKNIMSYTKMKWPDGFFSPPNTLVADDKCQICNVSLEYHVEYCKCITCSIAGGPCPPRRNADGKCSKCLAQEIVEKDINFYDSKILNVCANDDYQNLVSKTSSKGVKRKSTALQDVGRELYPTLAKVGEMLNVSKYDITPENMERTSSYHISWAVFTHLNNRKRYPYDTIEKQYFCRDCKLPSCLLALKILNNKISHSLSQDLVHYYQPISMSREELRSILPNIMLYNRKLVASNNGLDLLDVHDLVVKIYWIFIISVYAIYFIDYDDGDKNTDDDCNKRDKEKHEVDNCKPSYHDVLELTNNDIKANLNKLTGNKDDTKFLEFLDKVKSLSPYNNDVESNFGVGGYVNSEAMQKKLNDFFKISDIPVTTSQCDNIPLPVRTPTEDLVEPQPLDLDVNTTEAIQSKKLSKENHKKCCFDHSETGGEHCKENHSSKKRLKKDCNHARMNETRDRLRKKLSQIVNARKNTKPLQSMESSQASISSTATTASYAEAKNIMEHLFNPEELKAFQHDLPRPDLWDIQDFVASFDNIYNEANLCECLQNIKSNSKGESKSKNSKKIQCNNKLLQQQQQLQMPPQQEQKQQLHDINQSPMKHTSYLEPPNKKSNLSNNSTRDASTSSQGTKSKDNSSTNATTPNSTSKDANNLDFVNEICEIIDNYSKEQAKRKWIKETLSFIEGPTTGAGKKKTQPQTLNPKKAAKKAKQKQRKEEEKRIAELHDLRAQFHSIYFKEFSEKFNLKSLKANKKRDKRKISELECNIKNLQRAKAKVETAILELIATVKQTNTEFKFSYLPTKEQQIEKVRELEGQDNKASDRTIKVRNLLHQSAKEANQATTTKSPFTMTPTNNLNMVPESYSMPYAHANHFPYNLGLSTPPAPAPFGFMRASPMCYAPPSAATLASVNQQQLAPDVLASMAASAANNNVSDPSKRIVTIRRVNLPNVPEPQVTVTAKGPSPDKDKLLYTFINGQLIQTGTAPPITIPQMPAMKQPQLHASVSASNQTSVTNLSAEHLLSIPPPPPPKLSKTQLKKERKRLAALQVEREADRIRIEEKQQKLKVLKEQKELQLQQLELQQKQQKHQTKNKKNIKTQEQTKLASYPLSCNSKDTSIYNKKKPFNSNSTSTSTNECNESPKLPQMIALKTSSRQKRSDSTTTSCSAVTTTSSSSNSTSSQMNTRDNSVSSLKPVDLKAGDIKNNGKGKKLGTTQKPNSDNKNLKTMTSQLKPKQNKKPIRIPPTPSTTSTDAENEGDCEKLKTKKSKSPPLSSETLTQKTPAVKNKPSLNKQQKSHQKFKPAQRPITPPSSDVETEKEDAANIASTLKERKKTRPKLVDNGQFDNNPFKSLHMQDSDTESEEEDNLDNENEVKEETMKRPVARTDKVVIKKEVKFDRDEAKITIKSNSTHALKKKIEIETKEKTQLSASSPSGNKNSTNKSSKNNKNKSQKPVEKSDYHVNLKPNEATRGKQNLIEDENNSNKKTDTQKKNCQKNNVNTNGRKAKTDNRPSIPNSFSSQTKLKTKHANTSSCIQNEQLASSISCRNTNNSNGNENKFDQSNKVDSAISSNVENKNQSSKRSQRSKKYKQKSQKLSLSHKNCCSLGIPSHMGYFDENEVNLTSSSQPGNSNTSQVRSYQALTEQMQSLRLSGHQVQTTTALATDQQRQQHINSANVSIMDQLNRGVQVENLSLPPGITLTKVDPIKSEQLRQKSESIKKLAKPLQQQHHHLSQNSQTFHHSPTGATIIAPPIVNPIVSYYGSPYINPAVPGINPQSGVIMVEANPPKGSSISDTNVSSKQSKNKKRRIKSKANNVLACPMKTSGNKENSKQPLNNTNGGQPKMITLRNPMFHNGATGAAATILQQPALLTARPSDGFSMPVSLPVDQPAAIIKNENGMYTIRNPALHQAVTSGLALGGYRQFGGNVNYYTPQEAAAEAARATLEQKQQHIGDKSATNSSNTSSSSYSYFSNESVQTKTPHNNINITCTSIGSAEMNTTQRGTNNVNGLIGDSAVIQRPTAQQQRPISAIGSEIKNAQQQKQKTIIEQQWSNFVSDKSLPIKKSDNSDCNTSFLGTVSEGGVNTVAGGGGGVAPIADFSLQDKYHQSKYYNGFDVFTGSSSGNNSSTASCAQIHHSCGDDSPPPSISGYNSYLEGIPNTGVIRYDDASFLKNLIPGQNLNNEVSIHNVNDSNFIRSDQSPQAHRVEITPVYGNRPSPTNFRTNYRDTINDYSNDATTIFPNNIHLNLNELETSMKYEFEQTPPTAVATASDDLSHNNILDFKEILIKNGPTDPTSHRTSPYLDENTLEGFVQNMNSLQISNPSCEEQSSQLNGSTHCLGHGPTAATSTSNTPNGWW